MICMIYRRTSFYSVESALFRSCAFPRTTAGEGLDDLCVDISHNGWLGSRRSLCLDDLSVDDLSVDDLLDVG